METISFIKFYFPLNDSCEIMKLQKQKIDSDTNYSADEMKLK